MARKLAQGVVMDISTSDGKLSSLGGELSDRYADQVEANFMGTPDADDPKCMICDRRASDFDDDNMMILGEATTGFVLKLCFPCATGVTAAMLTTLPDSFATKVYKSAVMEGQHRIESDEAFDLAAHGLSAVFAVINPNIVAEKSKRG